MMENDNRKVYSESGHGQNRKEPQDGIMRRNSGAVARRKKLYLLYGVLSAVTLLLAAVLFGVAALLCGTQFAVYMRLVFIPLFAFAACFVNCLIAEKCKWMPAIVLAVCMVSYLLFCTVSLSVFPYLLLYGGNGALGYLIGRLVNSYTK